jgi:hypothetical protein
MLYLHEIHKVKPGAMEGLLEAVERRYLPLAARHRIRMVGYWQVAPGQGQWPETVAVWELDDFAHYVELTRRTFSSEHVDKELRDWHYGLGEWIQSSEGLACVPSRLTPTVEQIRARGLKAKLCTHELVHCKPFRQAEYLSIVEEMWWKRVAQPAGRSLIGLYYSPWKNTRAINIWGQGEDWERCAPMGKGESWTSDPDVVLWQTLGREIRTDWDDRFLVPAPFSTVR